MREHGTKADLTRQEFLDQRPLKGDLVRFSQKESVDSYTPVVMGTDFNWCLAMNFVVRMVDKIIGGFVLAKHH